MVWLVCVWLWGVGVWSLIRLVFFFFFFFCLLCAVSASLCFVEVSLILIISGVAAVLGGMIVEFIFDRLCSCVLLVMIAVVDCSALRFLYGFGSILRAGSICFGLCNFLEGLTLLVFFNGFLGVRWKRVWGYSWGFDWGVSGFHSTNFVGCFLSLFLLWVCHSSSYFIIMIWVLCSSFCFLEPFEFLIIFLLPHDKKEEEEPTNFSLLSFVDRIMSIIAIQEKSHVYRFPMDFA